MKHVAVAIAVLFAAFSADAQEKQEKPTPQKPQKEHELLKEFEGEWTVLAKCYQPSVEENHGTQTAKVKLGGFWLMFNYKSEMDGTPFEGHGMMGYDPRKSSYVGTWTDSWSPTMTRFEGKADATSRIITMTCDSVDPKTGQPMSHRMVMEITDADHWTHRFFAFDRDGKEALMSEMFYTRAVKK
jgi:hypothetical protein